MAVKILVQSLGNILILLYQKNKEVTTPFYDKTTDEGSTNPQNFMKIPYSAYHFRENPRPVVMENSVVPPRNG